MTHRVIRLLLPTDISATRDAARGVARFAAEVGTWSLVLQSPPAGDAAGLGVREAVRRVHAGPVDGVIARLVDEASVALARGVRVPLLNVSSAREGLPWPMVCADFSRLSELAAEHLYGCGYRRFAFYGAHDHPVSIRREEAFVAAVAELGLPCEVLREPDPEARLSAAEVHDRLTGLLQGLDPPVGLFAWNDWKAQQTLQCAAEAGVAVPRNLGVLGVGNDGVVCEVAPVPLSSVSAGGDLVGYTAARLLHRWIEHGERPPEVTPCGTLRLHQRGSTRVRLVDDEVVTRALGLMGDGSELPRTVAEVLDELPVSRRAFERRFVAATGLTPHQALTRARLDRAAQLLAQTTLSMNEVARRCGYGLGHRLAAAFRRVHGVSPSRYRQQHGVHGRR